ncbi:NAD(P)/FAD-dependent oxidoreductase [Silvimonas amylolytica]|uniref:NAD/FAD-binding protein n=1 Tax=Silvimonas amylolytica TaxID=449663 RepID=A0ABQ2PL59_9NEIS|nr:FAD-dependent oxidoreductase [Silvimonas amylolytica]GGP26126.1 NAD/FAD-binding protein [Silvimonas amylolytica]
MGILREGMIQGRRRVAVVGGGISGLASAWLIGRDHDVTLFEAASYAGGHTNTVDVTVDGVTHPVDTGFLVFNERTYPNLIALFAILGVAWHDSEMSFSVSTRQGRQEWAGTSLDSVFARRGNLCNPRFLGMLADILRFNRNSAAWLTQPAIAEQSLGQLLDAGGYGVAFRDDYLLPMAAAIWSCPTTDVLSFPALSFLQFCTNHGLLQLMNRPRWRTVQGGGRTYVQKLLQGIWDVRLRTPVLAVTRSASGVRLRTADGEMAFDAVVFATHAPTTLRILGDDATAQEREILGAIRYNPNRAVLHSDPLLLPRRQKVWAAWNYASAEDQSGRQAVCVSYLINKLQPLPFKRPVIVTLNPLTEPRPEHTWAEFSYEHPLLDQAAVAAQQRLPGLQGQQHIWFAGAWTGYGFHEDGLKSALRIARDFSPQPVLVEV